MLCVRARVCVGIQDFHRRAVSGRVGHFLHDIVTGELIRAIFPVVVFLVDC